MVHTLTPRRNAYTYSWWLVLSLVGLDYFSTLAYLPSIAARAAGPLAPLAAIGISLITLLAALPIYCYVVGRSPAGEGATGLLNRLVHGWFGKFLILVLLGFVAADFVITRSLSVADAAEHIVHNPLWQDQSRKLSDESAGFPEQLPPSVQWMLRHYGSQQLMLTVLLSLIGFGFYAFLQTRLTEHFLKLAAAVVVLYLLLTTIVLGSCLWHLAANPELIHDWWDRVGNASARGTTNSAQSLLLTLLCLLPKLALGLSGFELSMAVAPLVSGAENDPPEFPRGRIRGTRKLMVVAAVTMSVLVPPSVFVVQLLVPASALDSGGAAEFRALAYLAHGQQPEGHASGPVSALFGPVFGTLFDLSTVAILCLAGASAALGIRDLVPGFLARYGMQLEWARRVGVIMHLFNATILVVTVVFHASVAAQQQAYAASVVVMLTAAAVAAALDVHRRLKDSWWRWLAPVPFQAHSLLFLAMSSIIIVTHQAGLAIAGAFVTVVLATSLVSRYIRSHELRFQGFAFGDDASRHRWDAMRQVEFQVLVAHRPGRTTLLAKEDDVRRKHRLDRSTPIIFVEVELGDPSEFYQEPLLQIVHPEGREVIRVNRCASVPHVLAAIALEFAKVGRPPELIFGWSNEGPVASMFHFLFLGQGNVPWMTHELIRHVEPDPLRQPRVTLG